MTDALSAREAIAAWLIANVPAAYLCRDEFEAADALLALPQIAGAMEVRWGEARFNADEAAAALTGFRSRAEGAEKERDAYREALKEASEAIAEFYRYQYGGDGKNGGSYDGKPEREGLWRAQRKANAALAQFDGDKA